MRSSRHLASAPAAAQPGWRAVVGVAAAGLLVGCLLLALQFARLGWEPTAPLVVGTSWRLDEELAARRIPVRVTAGNGYDGQWFLGLAHDPLLARHMADGFDMPRYRAGRPLQAMTGWVLAGGRAGAIPLGLLAVGPLAVAVGCAACGRLLAAAGRSRWWGLGFALVPGVAVGVMFGTAEPLGLALAALGLSLVLDGRPLAGGLGFAGAALTKESLLVFAVAAAAWLVLDAARGPRARLAAAAAVLVPAMLALALWWAYVVSRVPAGGGDRNAIAAIGPPLAGWWHALGLVARGGYVPDAPVGPLGAVLLVGSLLLAVAATVLGVRSATLLGRTGLLLGLYGLVPAADLLGRFLSSMRALAPTVLAAGLAAAAAMARREARVPDATPARDAEPGAGTTPEAPSPATRAGGSAGPTSRCRPGR
jgi:hypothetical protein